MFMQEYDEANHIRHVKGKGIQEGRNKGITVLIQDNLEDGDERTILQKLKRLKHCTR